MASLASSEPADFQYDITSGRLNYVIHRQSTPNWRIQDLSHPGMVTIAYAADGEAHYQVEGERQTVRKGQMLLFGPGLSHTAAADPIKPWRFYSAVFPLWRVGDDKTRETPDFSDFPWVVTAEHPMAVEALFAELEMRWAVQEPGFELRCRAIILTLVHAFIEAVTRNANGDPNARQLMNIATFLQRNHTKSYSVEQLARRAGLSESRFRVLFKRTFGESVVRYQNSIRINRARSLLLSGEHSVSETARLVGIDDVYYFSRLFKKMTGVNPSDLKPV